MPIELYFRIQLQILDNHDMCLFEFPVMVSTLGNLSDRKFLVGDINIFLKIVIEFPFAAIKDDI